MSGTPDGAPTLLFINHWAGSLGGAEHSLLDIIARLSSPTRVHLVCSEQGVLTRRAEAHGAAVHVVPCRHSLILLKRDTLGKSIVHSWKALFSFAWFVVRVARVVRSVRPGAVHANVPKSHMTLMLLRRLGYRGPCLFHVREIFSAGTLPFVLYRWLFPRTGAAVIAISSAVRDALPPVMERVATVIHNGVAVPSSLPHRRRHRAVRFIYLGRVVPWKGCHLLIDMFRTLYSRYAGDGISLSIIGDTLYWEQEYRGRLEALITCYGLAHACRLLPNTEDPYGELSAHDVFCNASYQEPFGRSVAEAQACGLPVAAFSGGGIGEIVIHGTTGLLVDYGDAGALAGACARFIEEPDLMAAMGAAGHARVKDLFNREVQIPGIGEFILKHARGRDG